MSQFTKNYYIITSIYDILHYLLCGVEPKSFSYYLCLYLVSRIVFALGFEFLMNEFLVVSLRKVIIFGFATDTLIVIIGIGLW